VEPDRSHPPVRKPGVVYRLLGSDGCNTVLGGGFVAGTWQVGGAAWTPSRCCACKCCRSEWAN